MSRPEPAVTAVSASAGRPTSRGADPMAATAAAAVTSCSSATTRCAIWRPSGDRAHYTAGARRSRRRVAASRRRRPRRSSCAVPPGTEVLLESDGTRHDLVVPGQRALVARGGSGGRGNKRFADRNPSDAAVRRARPAGRRDVAVDATQAAGRRRADRRAERREVVAAGANDPRATEDRGLSVHDAVAGARNAARPMAGSW